MVEKPERGMNPFEQGQGLRDDLCSVGLRVVGDETRQIADDQFGDVLVWTKRRVTVRPTAASWAAETGAMVISVANMQGAARAEGFGHN